MQEFVGRQEQVFENWLRSKQKNLFLSSLEFLPHPRLPRLKEKSLTTWVPPFFPQILWYPGFEESWKLVVLVVVVSALLVERIGWKLTDVGGIGFVLELW